MNIKKAKSFVSRCEKDLPNVVVINNIRYELYANCTIHDSYNISYCEFDGHFFNWKNNPIRLSYKIVDVIPIKEKVGDGELSDSTIYVLSVDDIITDCLERVNKWRSETNIKKYDVEFHLPEDLAVRNMMVDWCSLIDSDNKSDVWSSIPHIPNHIFKNLKLVEVFPVESDGEIINDDNQISITYTYDGIKKIN